MRFSSPVTFANSCLACTSVSIMTQGDISLLSLEPLPASTWMVLAESSMAF